jgi:hypothetical protein
MAIHDYFAALRARTISCLPDSMAGNRFRINVVTAVFWEHLRNARFN